METLSRVCDSVPHDNSENQEKGKQNVKDEKLETNPDPIKKHNRACQDQVDPKGTATGAQERRNIREPSVFYSLGKEKFYFAGHEISIRESIDAYGALIWPGAVALCQFLENNQSQVNLLDKAVLEIGAGTGLLSIVASLLGACVTATDLPDILSNLTFNLMQNTKSRCRYTPAVAALTWGEDLESNFPQKSFHYDYVLAADVVYHHQCLEELLRTMHHFCRPGSQTTILWANKIRFPSDLKFTECFECGFNATLLMELPEQEVRIYKATAKE